MNTPPMDNEWESEDDAADAGDGGLAFASAPDVSPNSRSTTGIAGR